MLCSKTHSANRLVASKDSNIDPALMPNTRSFMVDLLLAEKSPFVYQALNVRNARATRALPCGVSDVLPLAFV